MYSQTVSNYSDIIKISCFQSPECEDGIVMEVATKITDNTIIECGEYDVDVSFNILEGISCITDPEKDIYAVKWNMGKNYSLGRNTITHISMSGIHDLKLQFKVRTICGQEILEEVHYMITNIKDCEGCYSAISYCDLFCNPHPEYNDYCGVEYYEDDSILYSQIPLIYSIKFFAYIQGVPYPLEINSTNNYGIFTFPYYTRDEKDCPNLTPGLTGLVSDLNKFLNLNRTGLDEYETFRGYVSLMDSYGDITEII